MQRDKINRDDNQFLVLGKSFFDLIHFMTLFSCSQHDLAKIVFVDDKV